MSAEFPLGSSDSEIEGQSPLISDEEGELAEVETHPKLGSDVRLMKAETINIMNDDKSQLEDSASTLTSDDGDCSSEIDTQIHSRSRAKKRQLGLSRDADAVQSPIRLNNVKQEFTSSPSLPQHETESSPAKKKRASNITNKEGRGIVQAVMDLIKLKNYDAFLVREQVHTSWKKTFDGSSLYETVQNFPTTEVGRTASGMKGYFQKQGMRHFAKLCEPDETKMRECFETVMEGYRESGGSQFQPSTPGTPVAKDLAETSQPVSSAKRKQITLIEKRNVVDGILKSLELNSVGMVAEELRKGTWKLVLPGGLFLMDFVKNSSGSVPERNPDSFRSLFRQWVKDPTQLTAIVSDACCSDAGEKIRKMNEIIECTRAKQEKSKTFVKTMGSSSANKNSAEEIYLE